MEKLVAPFVVPGYEPGLEGEPKSDEERKQILFSIKQMRLVQAGIESPIAKATLSGVMGFVFPFFLPPLLTAILMPINENRIRNRSFLLPNVFVIRLGRSF